MQTMDILTYRVKLFLSSELTIISLLIFSWCVQFNLSSIMLLSCHTLQQGIFSFSISSTMKDGLCFAFKFYSRVENVNIFQNILFSLKRCMSVNGLRKCCECDRIFCKQQSTCDTDWETPHKRSAWPWST